MPKSKKPRKRYNPVRIMNCRNLPGMIDMFRLFDPIYSVLETLEFGEIETVSGKPVFIDHEGTYSEVSAAMIGWACCWERICTAQGVTYDAAPLRKLAKKLENGVMLEVEDIERAKANIEFTRQVFRVTPASILKQHSITEQIAIEFEKRDLIKEAA